MEVQIRNWRRGIGALYSQSLTAAQLKCDMPRGRAEWVDVYEKAFSHDYQALAEMAINHANSLARHVAISILQRHLLDNKLREHILGQIVNQTDHFKDAAWLVRREHRASLTNILRRRFPGRCSDYHLLYVESSSLEQMTVNDEIRQLTLHHKVYLLKRVPEWFMKNMVKDAQLTKPHEVPIICNKVLSIYKSLRSMDEGPPNELDKVMAQLTVMHLDHLRALFDFENKAALLLSRAPAELGFDVPTRVPFYGYVNTMDEVVSQCLRLERCSASDCASRIKDRRLASDFVWHLFTISEWNDTNAASDVSIPLNSVEAFNETYRDQFQPHLIKHYHDGSGSHHPHYHHQSNGSRKEIVDAIFRKLKTNESLESNVYPLRCVADMLSYEQVMYVIIQFGMVNDDALRCYSYMAAMAYWNTHVTELVQDNDGDDDKNDAHQDNDYHNSRVKYRSLIAKILDHGHKEAPASRFYIERYVPQVLIKYVQMIDSSSPLSADWSVVAPLINRLCILYENCLQVKSSGLFWTMWKSMISVLDQLLKVLELHKEEEEGANISNRASKCMALIVDRVMSSENNGFREDLFKPFVGLKYGEPIIKDCICELLRTQDLTADTFWEVIPRELIDRALLERFLSITSLQTTRSRQAWLRLIKACKTYMPPEEASVIVFEILTKASGTLKNQLLPQYSSPRLCEYIIHEKIVTTKILSGRRFWLKWLRRAVSIEYKNKEWFDSLLTRKNTQWINSEIDAAIQLYWRRHNDQRTRLQLRKYLEANLEDLTAEAAISLSHLLKEARKDVEDYINALLDRQLAAKPSSSKWALQLACEALEEPATYFLKCLTYPNVHISTRVRGLGMLKAYVGNESVAETIKQELIDNNSKYFPEGSKTSTMLFEQLAAWIEAPRMRYDLLYALLMKYVSAHDPSKIIQLIYNYSHLEDPGKIMLPFVSKIASEPSRPPWVRPKAIYILCRSYADDITFVKDNSGRQYVPLPENPDDYSFFCGFIPPPFPLACQHAKIFVDHVVDKLDLRKTYLIAKILGAYDQRVSESLPQFCEMLTYVMHKVRDDAQIDILCQLYLMRMPPYVSSDDSQAERFCATLPAPPSGDVRAKLAQTVWFTLLQNRERLRATVDPWGHPVDPMLICCANYQH